MATGSAADFGQSRRKAERLLALTSILQQGRPVTLSELREQYDLYEGNNEDSARRKFERDKAELRDLGVEIATIKYDDIPAYWIQRESVKKTLIRWTDEELDTLAVLTATIGDDATGAALAKLAGSSGAFAVDEPPATIAMDLTIPGEVSEAIAEHRQLAIRYRNAEGVESERTIEPWDIRTRNGLLYIVGFDLQSDEERTFRVDRLVDEPTLGGPADHERPDGPPRPVYPDERFDIDAQVPASLRDDLAAAGGRVTGEGDDWLEVQFPQARSEPVLGWALRSGAVIVAPPELAEEARARAERLVRRHRGRAAAVPRPPIRPARTSTLSSVRLERLLALPTWLGERKGVTREEIASAFAITLEEVDAELELLDMIDVPGIGSVGEVEDRNGQIVYHRFVQEPVAKLTPTDALRLMLLVETGAAVLSETEAPALRSIAERLREALPASAQVEFAGLEHAELDGIKQAIREGQLVQFEYKGRKDTRWRDRDVAPSRLMVANGAIYLAGTDVHSGEERNFRLDRMTNVTLAGPIPAARVGTPRPTYVPTEDETEVVLLLSTKATWIVTQVTPDASAPTGNGGAVVVVRTDATDWLLSHVMAAGGEAELLVPQDLRGRIRKRAEQLLAAIEARTS